MKKVYTSLDPMQIQLRKALLEENEISCEVKVGNVGVYPVQTEGWWEIWVQDEDEERTVELLGRQHIE